MSAAPAGRGGRRLYLDWLRGIAVLLMIEAHLLDSWTGEPDRSSVPFHKAMMVGGMGTVLFLLLAGVAVALSAGSKARRWQDDRAAARAVVRRGFEIYALAFLFRFQAWLIGWSPNNWDLLKVDILNVMGLSIVLAAVLWRAGATAARRAGIFAAGTLGVILATPLVRAAPLAFLPDPIEAYIVPVSGMSNFVFFPWAGFVLAGAGLGVLIDATTGTRERRLNLQLAAAGLALAAGAYAASFLPSLYARSHFWTSSPSFFFIRLGLAMLVIAIAYAWTTGLPGPRRWSPIAQLGATSLFIYWIHVEMIYGLPSRPIHRSLTLEGAAIAFILFTGLMLILSVTKDRVVARFRGRR